MNFLNRINALLPDVTFGMHVHPNDIIIVTTSKYLEYAVLDVINYTNSKIVSVLLVNDDFKTLDGSRSKSAAISRNIKIRYIDLSHLHKNPGCTIVFYNPKFASMTKKEGIDFYIKTRKLMSKANIYTYTIFMSKNNWVSLFGGKGDMFLRENFENIEKAYFALEDDYSKDCYCRYLKVWLTRNFSYIRKSSVEYQYYNENITIKDGDVIVDGGISSDVGVINRFSDLVGKNGKVFGFEPVKKHFESSQISTRFKKNIEIINAGLWNSHDKLEICVDDLGASKIKSLGKLNDNIETCELIPLDYFVEKNKIKKLDVIKLDIEGAEPAALIGGRKSIEKFKPSLIICLYHEPEHMFSIINELNKWNLGYKFYVDTQSWRTWDFILFAKV